jgi:hypothetical protein
MPGHLRSLRITHSPKLILVLDDRIILRRLEKDNNQKCQHVHRPEEVLSMTRRHHRYRIRKDHPAWSRTAPPVTVVLRLRG